MRTNICVWLDLCPQGRRTARPGSQASGSSCSSEDKRTCTSVDVVMNRLLLSFLALALCPQAQAWERFDNDFGYSECVDVHPQRRFALKGEMWAALERKRGRAYANAHTTAVARFQWLRLLLLVEHAPQGECCRSNRPRQLSP